MLFAGCDETFQFNHALPQSPVFLDQLLFSL